MRVLSVSFICVYWLSCQVILDTLKLLKIIKEIIKDHSESPCETKDWKGAANSTFKTLAANNHSQSVRDRNDLYCTHPIAIDILLEKFNPSRHIWEVANGLGHLTHTLANKGYSVRTSDKYIYDSPIVLTQEQIDFLTVKVTEFYNGDIITNPPYKYAEQFIRKSLEVVAENNHVCMFLPIRYLEGQQRKKLFEEYPLKTLIVSSKRIECAKGGDFKGGSAQAYAWYIWQKGYNGKTIVEWV